jgi:hypothetical protein
MDFLKECGCCLIKYTSLRVLEAGFENCLHTLKDSMCFTSTSLPIGEKCRVIALEDFVN